MQNSQNLTQVSHVCKPLQAISQGTLQSPSLEAPHRCVGAQLSDLRLRHRGLQAGQPIAIRNVQARHLQGLQAYVLHKRINTISRCIWAFLMRLQLLVAYDRFEPIPLRSCMLYSCCASHDVFGQMQPPMHPLKLYLKWESTKVHCQSCFLTTGWSMLWCVRRLSSPLAFKNAAI